MRYKFRSTKTIGSITGILLVASIVLDGATLVLELIQRSFFAGIWESEGEFENGEAYFVMLYLLVGLLSVLVFVSTAVFFLIWIKRSYQNLFAFNVQSLTTTPGWAVGYWFIPLLCLYFPFKIVNEIHNGSDPGLGKDATRFSDTSGPTFHIFWWGLWVVGSIVSNITLRIWITSKSEDAIRIADMIDLIMLPLWMVCAWLAYEIVKEITRRQELVGNNLRPSEPPMPPVFEKDIDESI